LNVSSGIGHAEQNTRRHLEFRRFGFLCVLTFFALTGSTRFQATYDGREHA
jgi:hypothetical protein